MPKAEKGSLKDLGKKIKARGLQKLKFYCQMCEKQCRDANGFKCHLTSESHLRQMKVFSGNAGSFMDRYSKEFEKMYLDTLRMRHGTSKTSANNVYQEVIQDKAHIHMNATIWLTLTDFCKYLGKTGKCVVEETERGWYVTYIEQNVARLQQQEATLHRLELEKVAEQATHERMEQQRIEAAKALDRAGAALHTEATNLERSGDEGAATIQLSLAIGTTAKKAKAKRTLGKSVFGHDDDDDDNDDSNEAGKVSRPVEEREPESSSTMQANGRGAEPTSKRLRSGNDDRPSRSSLSSKRSAEEGTKKRAKVEMDPPDLTSAQEGENQAWLYRGILVRIINQDVATGKYFRCKGAVDKILDNGFSAEVVVTDHHDQSLVGDVLRLDQDDLETVAPKQPRERVRILRGRYRGTKALALDLDKKNCVATLELKDGTVLNRIEYDDFSKLG
jgi:DNA/RNA-binding protein KIN17